MQDAIVTGGGNSGIDAPDLFSLFARRTPAQTTELHVMISDGMKTVVEELTPQIEHSTGRKLAAQFNSSKNLRDKIQAGEPFDAAILTSDVLDDLIKQGKIASAGRAEISRTGMGMGVRAGAPKPDISTPEALKRTLPECKIDQLQSHRRKRGAYLRHVLAHGNHGCRQAEIDARCRRRDARR